jgi:hypothetical protein
MTLNPTGFPTENDCKEFERVNSSRRVKHEVSGLTIAGGGARGGVAQAFGHRVNLERALGLRKVARCVVVIVRGFPYVGSGVVAFGRVSHGVSSFGIASMADLTADSRRSNFSMRSAAAFASFRICVSPNPTPYDDSSMSRNRATMSSVMVPPIKAASSDTESDSGGDDNHAWFPSASIDAMRNTVTNNRHAVKPT